MDSEKRIKLMKSIIVACVVIFLIHSVVKYVTKNKTAVTPPPAVVIQKPKLQPMVEYVSQTGTIVSYNSVDLVARVEGYLEQVEFTDGTFVKKGKELFVIEPKPYLEKLKEAEASVVIQKASYKYANAEYERQKRMYKQNATSLNNVEKWAAQAEQAQAEIAKAIANSEIAAINYSYTHVLAPFDGRIGRHLVDPWNLVGHGAATDLATIQQIDPIYVYFNLNELDLLKIREAIRANAFKPAKIDQIPVYVGLQNETGFPHEGKLNFVNTGLNASTGTMEFRALLSNKNYVLLPGLFVKVRIPIAKPKLQLTIPDEAVQYDQIGAYLLTVNKNNYVILKRVVTGAVEQGTRAIVKGLDPQDDVVVSGLQNAIPGDQVQPVQNKKK